MADLNHLSQGRRIDSVILWQNGMVMVFDQFGKQYAEYQGKVEDVRDRIVANFAGEWEHRDWNRDRHWLQVLDPSGTISCRK